MPPFEVAAFRTSFPEFSDAVAYPTATITFWAGLAAAQVPQNVWKSQWLVGVSLYVAHEITIASQNAKISTVGGMPGTSGGVPNTKTVGNATVGFDSQSTSEANAAYWNLTNYGKQFIRLCRIFGAGAIQL